MPAASSSSSSSAAAVASASAAVLRAPPIDHPTSLAELLRREELSVPELTIGQVWARAVGRFLSRFLPGRGRRGRAGSGRRRRRGEEGGGDDDESAGLCGGLMLSTDDAEDDYGV